MRLPRAAASAFIDDLPRKIEAARAAWMHGVQFLVNGHSLEKQLAAPGVLAPD